MTYLRLDVGRHISEKREFALLVSISRQSPGIWPLLLAFDSLKGTIILEFYTCLSFEKGSIAKLKQSHSMFCSHISSHDLKLPSAPDKCSYGGRSK